MKSRVISAVLLALLLQGCSKPPDAEPTASAVRSAAATGTIKSIDTAGGLITLAHEPVESLGWPAMVMPFKATAAQIGGLKVGQKVRVEFQAQDMNATITKISPEQ